MRVGNIEVYGVIYKIRNKVNNKVYIGQTTRGFNGRYQAKGFGIERVYNYHMNMKKYNENYNLYLVSSIEKYGFDNFEVDKVFDVGHNEKELNDLEYLYIKIYNTTDRKYGYNFKEGGHSMRASEDSKSKLGVKIVCLNDSNIYKSLEEASRYYNIPTSYIKKTFSQKFYKNNFPLLRFKKISNKTIINKGDRFCICCGKKFKRNKNNNRKFCKDCSNLNNKGLINKFDINIDGLNIKKTYYYENIKSR